MTNIIAQPSIQWQKCLGGSGIDAPKNSIRQTTDGGILLQDLPSQMTAMFQEIMEGKTFGL